MEKNKINDLDKPEDIKKDIEIVERRVKRLEKDLVNLGNIDFSKN